MFIKKVLKDISSEEKKIIQKKWAFWHDEKKEINFTKEELARIKELLEELQKQRAESGQAPLSPEEYIQALKQDVQTAIYEVTGKKVDLDNETIQNIMNLQKSGGNETFVKPTTDEELRLVDEFKKASK